MSNTACSSQNLNVKHVANLFDEVQIRYATKLTSIDEKYITSDERHKQKLAVYESYVKDLSIQTRLLLQSLDELEKEANQRVILLENKLKKAQVSLQQQSLSDVAKTVNTVESEKWKLTHENLDLKHDIDSLVLFINTAKRTGKWDAKKLQLKSLPIDRIIGVTNDETNNTIPLHKEIQYRDERIQVLQAEIEQLRRTQYELTKQATGKSTNFSSLTNDDDSKAQNVILTKKIDDLREKLSEECQRTETLKMDVRLKTNQLKELQEEQKQSKQHYEEHIQDLSTKLKTIADRQRESTALLNNDIKNKKQQIEQYTQQIEQIISEKSQLENDRNELQKHCRIKDALASEFEERVRTLQRELAAANSYSVISKTSAESTVSRIEYEKLDQELNSTKKRLDLVMNESKSKEALITKLEQDVRTIKKTYDEQLEQYLQTNTNDVDHLQSEIRALKRLCEEKDNDLHKQLLELRTYQDNLSIERNKTTANEQEHTQLCSSLQMSKEQIEKCHHELKQITEHNEQLEYAVHELNARNNLIETKLIEAMSLIDIRNKQILDNEQQTERIKTELVQKHQDLVEKQHHIDELERMVIDKTAETAHLTETLETNLVKNHQREKFAEENASKAIHDMKHLQREFRHLTEKLAEAEHANAALNEQVQQLNSELKKKNDEFNHMQKSLNKQLTSKQDQLVRYDQTLHEMDIKSKYAKEECLIQEKEIIRLNNILEEQQERIKSLQQDLLKLQQENENINIQCQRTESDLRNVKIYREDENRKHIHEIERLNNEIHTLKINEEGLMKNIDDLKESLSHVTNERDDIREQNEQYQNEIENVQKILYDETESGSKLATKVASLTRQLDEEQKRSTESTSQLDDTRIQLKSVLMTNDTLKSELSHSRALLQEHMIKETDFKQNLSRTNSLLEERNKTLDERQRELESLNHLLTRLQVDYEKSKNDLSGTKDEFVQQSVENQTLKQYLSEKSLELTAITNRFHQIQQDFHAYEKEHRYSNEEHFEREQRLKSLENELSTTINNHERLQHEQAALHEDLIKCRHELEQMELSDISHREQLLQATDEGKIYKRKLALLGDCFKTIVRKASDTSERWANITSRLHEQITDLNEHLNKLRGVDERFEQSTKALNILRSQHEDLILQYMTIKPVVEKAHLYVREYKRKLSQTNDENHRLRMETKRMKSKIEDFHRAESLMHEKLDQQELNLTQLRKELNNESHTHSEAQTLIERLKRTLDETVHDRDQLLKNIGNANKKIEKYEEDLNEYNNEKRLLTQTTLKLEKQLANAHAHNESLERTMKQNELSYQEKINECESLLISLKNANQDSLCLLEQKKLELNMAQSDIQSFKYEQSAANSKIGNMEEMHKELERHIAILERSNDEHKRSLKRREKELEQIKNEFEQHTKTASTLNAKCAKQEAEMNTLRIENETLNEELKLMRENVARCQEEQRRLRKDCDQALNFIQDGIPELCLDDGNINHDHNRNGVLQEHLKKLPCLMQQLTGDRENLKTKNELLVQFVRGLTCDLNSCQNSQKKYKLLKAHSKQQQLLLNQLEAHVRFYENVFKEKGFFPAIDYSSTGNVASAPDVIDNNYQWKK